MLEGTSSISDSLGNLLFYTDGITVWNKLHATMDNGDSLLGHQSSTQSALIVQRPCHKDQFYIFTTPFIGLGQLHYSEVDLSLNGGLGAITSVKNIPLGTNPTSEKLAAVWHADEQSLWLISQEPFQTNRFYVYSISSNGVDTNAVVSTAGVNENDGQGSLKSNIQGNMLISCTKLSANILNFDPATGIVSDKFVIPMSAIPQNTALMPSFYDAEFSPNGNLVYITLGGGMNVYQIDLTQPTEQDVIGSLLKIGSSPLYSGILMGALQLGPDGKIYAARGSTDSLARINNPNTLGLACGFTYNAIPLNGVCLYGLPSFQRQYRYYFDECPLPTFPEPEKPEVPLEIPNIITPNGDGTNDSFILKNVVPGQVSLTIANRWGNTVFFSDAYLNDWNGEAYSDGVYFYHIHDSKTGKTHSGFVEVIR
jgi:gliding motility-associated-like protein